MSKRVLLDRLIWQITSISDENQLERIRTMAYLIIDTDISRNEIHNGDFWIQKWKNKIEPRKKPILGDLIKNLPVECMKILIIFDQLKNYKEILVYSDLKNENKHKNAKYIPWIEDKTLIQQFSQSIFNQYNSYPEKFLNSKQKTVFYMINYVIRCMYEIDQSAESLFGIIGSKIKHIVNQTLSETKERIRKILISQSLISIYAAVFEQIVENTCFLCQIMVRLKNSQCYFNCISICMSHGSPVLKSIGGNLLSTCITPTLDFICDWVVFGKISDPHKEFFIAKMGKKINSSDWWDKKFFIVNEHVPQMIVDSSILDLILITGKAKRFIRKFKSSCINYTNNFGSNAPYGIDLSISYKEKQNYTWKGPPFQLSMIENMHKEANSSMMYMIKNIIWIYGHLLTIRDYVLFCRGDFAHSLFTLFYESEDGDAQTLLNQAIVFSYPGTKYMNPITTEQLHNRVDLATKWTTQPRLEDLSLVYHTNPPIDIILNPAILIQYQNISSYIWHINCLSYRIDKSWFFAKRLDLLSYVFFSSKGLKQICALRHFMILTLRSILEYFSTDIILFQWNSLENRIADSTSLSDIIDSHKKYISAIWKGLFMDEQFSQVNTIIDEIFKRIEAFLLVNSEMETIYHSFIEYVNINRRWKVKGNKFYDDTKKKFNEKQSEIQSLFVTFNNTVNQLYSIAYDETKSREMQSLEIRLRSCIMYLH